MKFCILAVCISGDQFSFRTCCVMLVMHICNQQWKRALFYEFPVYVRLTFAAYFLLLDCFIMYKLSDAF